MPYVVVETGEFESMMLTRTEDGYALPLVLALLTVLAGSIIASTSYFHSSMRTLATASDRIKLRLMINSAVEHAAVTVVAGSRNDRSPVPSRYRLSAGEWSVIHSRESGRIDINHAEPPLLTLLFRYGGMSEGEIQHIIDTIQSRRLGLGKGRDSTMAGTPMAYRSIEELSEQGMPASALHKLAPLLTVFSGRKEFDPRQSDVSIFSIFPNLTGLQRRRFNDLINTTSTSKIAWSEVSQLYQHFFTFEDSRVHRFRIRITLANGMTGTSEVVITCFDHDTEPYRLLYRRDSI